VDQHDRHRLRRKLGIPASAQVVTYTGRLVTYKGLPLLLRVWRELHAQHPNAQLWLVGAGGLDIHNCEAALKAFVVAHDLDAAVRFPGAVENVHEYLQASDLFVFPTENEAFGLSLVEAMACGLPVVSTRVGGIKDIIVPGTSGVLVQAGQPDELHAALDGLLRNSALAERLGQNARRWVLETCSSDAVIDRYLQLFDQLLDGRAQPAYRSI
jgi:glycosyltransferase involved in cell wall biosynthesis